MEDRWAEAAREEGPADETLLPFLLCVSAAGVALFGRREEGSKDWRDG